MERSFPFSGRDRAFFRACAIAELWPGNGRLEKRPDVKAWFKRGRNEQQGPPKVTKAKRIAEDSRAGPTGTKWKGRIRPASKAGDNRVGGGAPAQFRPG